MVEEQNFAIFLNRKELKAVHDVLDMYARTVDPDDDDDDKLIPPIVERMKGALEV